jgi:tetraacyldisaccharide 4'-kinase
MDLYVDDFFLPTGDLRDQKSSASRADIIVVTKCKPELSEQESRAIRERLNPLPSQQVFFTSIQYGNPYHLVHRNAIHLHKEMEVLLVCGIANPEPLKQYLHDETLTYEACYYSDHHIFSVDDIREIRKRFEAMDAREKIIVTTEKDAVRLLKYGNELGEAPFYVLPIGVRFLFSGARNFNDLVVHFVQHFSQGEAQRPA